MEKNHRRKINRNESGQVIVILAASFVILLGFAALAIDGGMYYSDRRHAQSAADAASLAGGSSAAYYMRYTGLNYGSFLCGSSGVVSIENFAKSEAINIAGLNDYLIDNDISDKHGVDVVCEIQDNGTYEDKHIDIITQVTRETQSNFAHLFFEGSLVNEVEAVARIYPPTPLAFGKAIIALDDSPCSGNQNGVIFSGNSQTTVTGGGVWSNGCLNGNGTSFTVKINGGNIGYAGSAVGTLSNIDPLPIHNPNQIPEFATIVSEPDCSSLPSRTVPKSGDAVLEPGVYADVKWQGGSLTLNPGLYCVTSSQGVNINGGSVQGDGVTIFLTTGGITINGSVTPVDLRAPGESPDPAPAIPGILFYLANGNQNTISVIGNSTSFYLGTLYAPDGQIYLSGSSGTNPTYNTQLMANSVEVSGGATIDINFFDDENYEMPPFMDLLK